MSLLPIIQGGTSVSAGFDPEAISHSVWLDGSADCIKATLGAKTRTRCVIGTWVQKTAFNLNNATIFSKANPGSEFSLRMDENGTNGKLTIFDFDGSSFQYNAVTTTKVLRDHGWYHIMISIDTTASAGSRLKLFINGIDQTSTLTVSTDYTASDNPSVTGTTASQWGIGYNGSQYLKCYLAQSFMLDDDSIQNGDVAVSDILATAAGRFVPKASSNIAALASSAGGHSFCLDYSNSSDLGNDASTNNNDFTVTSITSVNQVAHSPSSPFPILSGINGDTGVSNALDFGARLNIGVADWRSIYATIPFTSSGKYYVEVRMHNDTASNGFIVGIQDSANASKAFSKFIGDSSSGDGYSIYTHSYRLRHNGANTVLKSGVVAAGDILQVAIDCDNNNVWFGDDDSYFGASAGSSNPATGTNPSASGITSGVNWVFGHSSSATEDYFVNFGQDGTFGGTITAAGNSDANSVGSFKYAPPSGFLALHPSNLTALSFSNPATGSFEGNASTNGPFVFLGFQPSISDALTINSNSVTYGTDVDLCSNGFKVRSSSSNFNATGTNNYSLVTTNALQINGEFPPAFAVF